MQSSVAQVIHSTANPLHLSPAGLRVAVFAFLSPVIFLPMISRDKSIGVLRAHAHQVELSLSDVPLGELLENPERSRISLNRRLAEPEPEPEPHLVKLRRESVPVLRLGKIASYKTSYSGLLHVGHPSQEFRVVFDTGSGHLVLPAVECMSESCQVHRTYNVSASTSSEAINLHGGLVFAGETSDQLSINYGTGTVLGEFVRDTLCFGVHTVESEDQNKGPRCLNMRMVVAIEMSTRPFKDFQFDGILGLGLPALSVSSSFSFLHQLALDSPRGEMSFGIFLTEGDAGEESEIAIGGYNKKRLLEPLTWSPVSGADLGFWQVEVKAFRIDGVEHEMCMDGMCRAIVDSGTSHLGIPKMWKDEIESKLQVDAENLLDCRLAPSPVIEIEVANRNLTLYSSTYMRRLPLRNGLNVGSVEHTSESTKSSLRSVEVTAEADSANVSRHCSPRLMHVNLPTMGDKFFVLGETVLHRYYTVFDWSQMRVGFGLAANNWNIGVRSGGERGELPHDVEVLLAQTHVEHSVGKRLSGKFALTSGERGESDEDEEDSMAFLQVIITLRHRSPAC